MLLQTHQTIHVIPAVVTVVCRRIAVAAEAAAAVPVALSPNQSPESAEVASAATSADATDALADREGEEAGMGK